MQPILYAHPFASYCWKVLIALYENDTAFTYRSLGSDDPQAATAMRQQTRTGSRRRSKVRSVAVGRRRGACGKPRFA